MINFTLLLLVFLLFLVAILYQNFTFFFGHYKKLDQSSGTNWLSSDNAEIFFLLLISPIPKNPDNFIFQNLLMIFNLKLLKFSFFLFNYLQLTKILAWYLILLLLVFLILNFNNFKCLLFYPFLVDDNLQELSFLVHFLYIDLNLLFIFEKLNQ